MCQMITFLGCICILFTMCACVRVCVSAYICVCVIAIWQVFSWQVRAQPAHRLTACVQRLHSLNAHLAALLPAHSLPPPIDTPMRGTQQPNVSGQLLLLFLLLLLLYVLVLGQAH